MKLPYRKMTKALYPDIDDGNVDKLVPILYGKCAAVGLVSINENENPESASTDAVYKLPDGMSDIGTVYVQVENVWKAAVNPVADYTAGTLTIKNGRDSSGSTREVKLVDCYGYMFSGHSYPREVLEHLFSYYYGIQLTASNFDLAEWETELDSIQSDIGVLLNDATEFWEIVYKISCGCKKLFRVEWNAGGLITARVKDFDRASSATIASADIKDADILNVETDRSGVYSSVVVKYYPNKYVNTWLSVENNTYQDEVRRTYRKDEALEEETYLTTLADAEARAYEDATRVADVPMVLSCTVDGNLGLRIYDVVTISIQPDNLDASSRVYFGNRDCLIIGVKPDLLNRTNTIRALIIPDRVPSTSQSSVLTSSYTPIQRTRTATERLVSTLATKTELSEVVAAEKVYSDSVVTGAYSEAEPIKGMCVFEGNLYGYAQYGIYLADSSMVFQDTGLGYTAQSAMIECNGTLYAAGGNTSANGVYEDVLDTNTRLWTAPGDISDLCSHDSTVFAALSAEVYKLVGGSFVATGQTISGIRKIESHKGILWALAGANETDLSIYYSDENGILIDSGISSRYYTNLAEIDGELYFTTFDDDVYRLNDITGDLEPCGLDSRQRLDIIKFGYHIYSSTPEDFYRIDNLSADKIIISEAGITITLPRTVEVGRTKFFRNVSTGNVTIAFPTGETLNGETSIIIEPDGWVSLDKYSTTEWGYSGKSFDESTYATLDSPAFTGTPTAPTADPGTSTTQIATTEFVMNAIPSGSGITFVHLLANISGHPYSVTQFPTVNVGEVILVRGTLYDSEGGAVRFKMPATGTYYLQATFVGSRNPDGNTIGTVGFGYGNPGGIIKSNTIYRFATFTAGSTLDITLGNANAFMYATTALDGGGESFGTLYDADSIMIDMSLYRIS